MGWNESVTVARTAPGGAPVAASSNSRPPTPMPCASGKMKRWLRNHQSPRTRPAPQPTIWRPPAPSVPPPPPVSSSTSASATQKRSPSCCKQVPVRRRLLVVLGDALLAGRDQIRVERRAEHQERARQVRLLRAPVRHLGCASGLAHRRVAYTPAPPRTAGFPSRGLVLPLSAAAAARLGPLLQQPRSCVAHSSRGLGRRPLTAVTWVRIPYALPLISRDFFRTALRQTPVLQPFCNPNARLWMVRKPTGCVSL